MPRSKALPTGALAGEVVARGKQQTFRIHAKNVHRRWTQRRGAVRARQERRCSSWLQGVTPEALAPKALALLRRAQAEVNSAGIPGSPEEAMRCYSSLMDVLRQLQTFAEPEMRLWTEAKVQVADVERRLRLRALDIWDAQKVHIAKAMQRSESRIDLLRPPVGEVTCSKIWTHLRKLSRKKWKSPNEMLVTLLADVSGCTQDVAQRIMRQAQHSSEHFAPLELALRIARQNWNSTKPYALGVALLPLLEQVLHKLATERTAAGQQRATRVTVLGGCCIAAALASRLGCEVIILERRASVKQMLEAILADNALDVRVCDESQLHDAVTHAEVLVWEGVEDDAILELGDLATLRFILKERSRQGLAPSKLVPERLRIAAAPVDDAISSVRGYNLTRFDNLRMPELGISHRWPSGACHLQPILRATAQVVWDVDLRELIKEPEWYIHERLLSFSVEIGERVTGMAFWIDAPSDSSLPPSSDCQRLRIGHPAEAWVACVHQLPPRRVNKSRPLQCHAARTDSRIWFEWTEDADDASLLVAPCISKARLPQWHFKMLNDHERNRRYESAIQRAVRRAVARNVETDRAGGLSVLDCGCGAGLLSLCAARAGASKAQGLEISSVIGDISKETFAGYIQERRVTEKSTSTEELAISLDVQVSDVRALDPDDIGKYDIIVSELMDASGTGESLLSVLQHACHSFAKVDTQVIPCEFEIHVAVGWMHMPDCHGSLNFRALDPIWFCATRGGPFAIDAKEARPDRLHCGAGKKTPNTPTLQYGPFSSRNTNRLKRGEVWDLLTSEVLIKRFDIASALRGENLYPTTGEVEVVALEDGIVNCLHWWWTAKLDEATSLSNRPLESGGMYQTHWHQPWEPLGPFPVRKGDRLRLKLSMPDSVGQKLCFSVEPAEPGAASAWSEPPQLPPEPLSKFLAQWSEQLEEIGQSSEALTNQYTRVGDVRGVAGMQRAIIAISTCPALFGCDPHVRDRLIQTWFGMTM